MVYENKSDKELLVLLKSNDELVLGHIYKNNYPLIRQFILQNSGTVEEAKDVYQDAMIILFENVHKSGFMLTSKISTYLYSIARRLWLKKLAEKKRELEIKDNDSFVNVYDVVDEFAIKEERLNKIDKGLSMLGEPCKTILTDFFHLKYTMQQIAEKMGYTNAANAKNQKYKCLKRLRVIVEKI